MRDHVSNPSRDSAIAVDRLLSILARELRCGDDPTKAVRRFGRNLDIIGGVLSAVDLIDLEHEAEDIAERLADLEGLIHEARELARDLSSAWTGVENELQRQVQS
jgi:hypothetical protein